MEKFKPGNEWEGTGDSLGIGEKVGAMVPENIKTRARRMHEKAQAEASEYTTLGAEALVWLGKKTYVEEAVRDIKAGLESHEIDIQEQAVRRARDFPDPELINSLLELADLNDEDLDDEILETLGKYDASEVIRAATELIKPKDGIIASESRRRLGAAVLREKRNPAAREGLLLLQRDTEADIAEQARSGLQEIILDESGLSNANEILKLLKSRDIADRKAKIKLLNLLGEYEALSYVDPLIEELENETDSLVASHIIETLGKAKDERAVWPLKNAIKRKGQKKELILKCISALRIIGGNVAKDELEELAQEPDLHIKKAAEDVLKALPSEKKLRSAADIEKEELYKELGLGEQEDKKDALERFVNTAKKYYKDKVLESEKRNGHTRRFAKAYVLDCISNEIKKEYQEVLVAWKRFFPDDYYADLIAEYVITQLERIRISEK